MSRPGFALTGAIQTIKGEKRIVFDSLNRYHRLLDALRCDRVTVTIEREVKRRSQKQNAWIWGCAYEFMLADSGYELNELKEAKEALHYSLIRKCFGTTWDARVKDYVPNVRSSKLSTEQFSQYMEWLQRHAAQEWNVIVPSPNEEWMFDRNGEAA